MTKDRREKRTKEQDAQAEDSEKRSPELGEQEEEIAKASNAEEGEPERARDRQPPSEKSKNRQKRS